MCGDLALQPQIKDEDEFNDESFSDEYFESKKSKKARKAKLQQAASTTFILQRRRLSSVTDIS